MAMLRKKQSQNLSNDTPVILTASTCHRELNGHAKCGTKDGRRVLFAQVRVYLAVQWCSICWNGSIPR